MMHSIHNVLRQFGLFRHRQLDEVRIAFRRYHSISATEAKVEELQRRQRELETPLAEERGQRKACEETWQQSTILLQGPS